MLAKAEAALHNSWAMMVITNVVIRNIINVIFIVKIINGVEIFKYEI